MGDPLSALLHSRKFWVGMLDVVLSTLLYFVTKYADPALADDVKFLIAAWQPVFLIIIGAIAYEDGQEKRAGFATYTEFISEPEDPE